MSLDSYVHCGQPKYVASCVQTGRRWEEHVTLSGPWHLLIHANVLAAASFSKPWLESRSLAKLQNVDNRTQQIIGPRIRRYLHSSIYRTLSYRSGAKMVATGSSTFL